MAICQVATMTDFITTDSDTIRAAIEQAINGDKLALKLLLTDSHERTRNFIASKIPARLRSILDPDDVLQDVHVEVFRRISSFESQSPESFHRWLATVALTRLRNAIKKQEAAKRGGQRNAVREAPKRAGETTVAILEILASPVGTPSRSVARREAIVAVHGALQSLPEHYGQAIRLVHIEGRTIKQAAAEMKRSERAVHGLCRRGIKLLEEHLGHASKFLSVAD